MHGIRDGTPSGTSSGTSPTVSHTGDGEKVDTDYKKYKAQDGAFFHEPRVNRGDVVLLSVTPRSGI